MKVKLIWEDCTLLNGDWSDRAVTSYWLEAEAREIENILFYAIDTEQLLNEIEQNKNQENKFCLLISEDLESIMSFPDYYPDSGQWNGDSPFREIPEVEIAELDELSMLKF